MPQDEFSLAPTGLRRKATRRARTPADRLSSPSATERVKGVFMQAYERRYGFPPIVNEGRDGKLLKTLVEQWGEPTVLALVDAFFAATKPGVRGYQEIRRLRWHNIPDFYTGAQILRRLEASGPELSEKTASNLHEILKATEDR